NAPVGDNRELRAVGLRTGKTPGFNMGRDQLFACRFDWTLLCAVRLFQAQPLSAIRNFNFSLQEPFAAVGDEQLDLPFLPPAKWSKRQASGVDIEARPLHLYGGKAGDKVVQTDVRIRLRLRLLRGPSQTHPANRGEKLAEPPLPQEITGVLPLIL